MTQIQTDNQRSKLHILKQFQGNKQMLKDWPKKTQFFNIKEKEMTSTL